MTQLVSIQPKTSLYLAAAAQDKDAEILPLTADFLIIKETSLLGNFESIYGKEQGYIIKPVENAAGFLKNIKSSGQTLPKLIICSGQMSEKSIQSFVKYLKTDFDFMNIPLVYNTTGIPEETLKQTLKMRCFDDTISLPAKQSLLLEKAVLLSKVKKMNMIVNPAELITEKQNKICASCGVKRSVDILVSGTALLLLSPLFLLIGLLIRLESRGPVFYKSYRAGRGYRIFPFYKFRSMSIDADKQTDVLVNNNQYNADTKNACGPMFYKVNNDPRVTKVGSFLRKTSMDELPQLINVFLGHMSLVGNRPLPLYEARELTTDSWAERFMAPAGITGLWQVKKRGQQHMSAEERINLDIEYARKSNFLYDVSLMMKTPAAMIQRANV